MPGLRRVFSLAGGIGCHLPSTRTNRVRPPDRLRDPALDFLPGIRDHSHRPWRNESRQCHDRRHTGHTHGHLSGGRAGVRFGEGAGLGSGGTGHSANRGSMVVLAIPLRRFLAAFRLGFDAQPGVLRRAIRLGRHTLYRSNRFAQLLRFQPAGLQWLTPSTGWAWCSCR